MARQTPSTGNSRHDPTHLIPVHPGRLFTAVAASCALLAYGGDGDNSGPAPGPALARVPADAPQTRADGASGKTAGGVRQTITVNVLANDTATHDAIDPASARIEAAGGDGRTLQVRGRGGWRVQPDGSIGFTPQSGASGAITPIRYTLADVTGRRSAAANVSVTYGDASTGGGQGSLACSNEAMYSPGSNWSTAWRSLSSGEGNPRGDVRVIGVGAYRGKPSAQVETHDAGGTVALAYGAIVERFYEAYDDGATLPNGTTLSFYYDPPMRPPRDLPLNPTYTMNYVAHQSGHAEPAGMTTTYEGRETLTLPAGTFDTCRMRHTSHGAQGAAAPGSTGSSPAARTAACRSSRSPTTATKRSPMPSRPRH